MGPSGGIVIIIDMRTKPELATSVRDLLHDALPEILGFDGALFAALHVNQDDSTNLMLIEHWVSREHFEKYRAWRAQRGDHANLTSMLAGPLMVRAFDVVG